MDQLTSDFFSNPFPGLSDNIEIQNDILSSNLPVVEVPLDIDYKHLLALSKQIPIDEVIRSTYPYEKTPRLQGWDMQILWSDGTVVPWVKDLYYKVFADAIPYKSAEGPAENIKNKLAEYGITARTCMVSKFSPGGYLRPHRDISLTPRPLSYFWLPLNSPTGSELKIYPLGTVNINLGCMYLLNQENYTHAVINRSNEDRYVLVGYLDNPVSDQLLSKIKASVFDKY